MDNHSPVLYHVDDRDRLDAFNAEWLAFAHANHGESLHPSQIRGRLLWDFLAGPTTTHLYQAMVERVRKGGPAIRFRFRCDAPDAKRLLEMEITGDRTGGIQFGVSRIIEQARAVVPLLDSARTPGEGLLAICAWCKRVRLDTDDWAEVEEAVRALNLLDGAPLPALTHGICPPCSASLLEVIEAPAVDRSAPVTMGAIQGV